MGIGRNLREKKGCTGQSSIIMQKKGKEHARLASPENKKEEMLFELFNKLRLWFLFLDTQSPKNTTLFIDQIQIIIMMESVLNVFCLQKL